MYIPTDLKEFELQTFMIDSLTEKMIKRHPELSSKIKWNHEPIAATISPITFSRPGYLIDLETDQRISVKIIRQKNYVMIILIMGTQVISAGVAKCYPVSEKNSNNKKIPKRKQGDEFNFTVGANIAFCRALKNLLERK